jgi:hypothetical protein
MKHITVICLVSALVSFLLALTIFTLRRSARILPEKRWAKPFGITFFVLGGMYSLRYAVLVLEGFLEAKYHVPLSWAVKVIVLSASGLTTYLIMLSAFRLAERALPERWAKTLRKVLVERRDVALTVLCFAGLIQIVPDVWRVNRWVRVSALLPDNAFSALALLSMGLVLFQNIHFRRDKFMARLVLWSSAGYALLYLVYFVNDVVSLIANDKNLLMFTAALVLKMGLFFPAFSLLLLESAPLIGVEKLLKSITRQNKEYLESGGIVKSIRNELRLDRVDLYVRLPGNNENRIARFSYPLNNEQDPQILEYEEGTSYHRVFTTREPDFMNHGDYSYRLLYRISEITVPIFFHDAVIACLKVQLGEEKFTEVDLSNLRRIATMISPAVQTYREMFALNKLSQDLSALQIEVDIFELDKDINRMCERIHNVTSSTVVGLSIEAGFCEYHGIDPHEESLHIEVNELLHVSLESEDFRSADGSLRWLSNELKMNPPARLWGEQVFGRFLFGIKDTEPTNYPPIGTSPLCRRALTDLVTDTLLDFIRGHLNQLTDQLGEKLSGFRGTDLQEWHAAVEDIAKSARLSWVVVSSLNPGDEGFGNAEAVQLIDKIEAREYEDKWQSTKTGFSFCRVAEANVSCVIRKGLTQSGHTIWFGVAHEKFGPELEFISPWTYFLKHFCAIADSSLKVLIDRKQHRDGLKPMFDLAIGVHRLANLCREIHSIYVYLNDGLDRGTIQCSENEKTLIRAFQAHHDELEQLLQTFVGIKKRDERVGVPVIEILESVSKAVNGQLSKYNINFEIRGLREESRKTLVGVPVYVVTNAFSVIIDNAREAFSAQSPNGHKREITMLIDDSSEQNLICSVIDNGPGVPPPIIPRLFRKPCPTSKLKSHGFGLFGAYYLLWAFDGNITYHRERVRDVECSVFRITLPRYRTKQ